MKEREIRGVTTEELAQANTEISATKKQDSFSVSKNNNKLENSTEYIKKLSIDEIQKFFEPFNIIFAAKVPNDENPEFVYVECEDFAVTFSDFQFVFDMNGGLFESEEFQKGKFDMKKTRDSFEKAGITVEQAISELMVTKLFGSKYPSYVESWAIVRQAQIAQAFNELSSKTRKLFANVQEKAEHGVESTQNKSKYGVYDVMKNYYGN